MVRSRKGSFTHHHEAIGKIVTHIRRIKPQVVVTFASDGAYGHPDHIAIGQFTNAAIVCAADSTYKDNENLESHRVSKLYYMVDTESFYFAVERDMAQRRGKKVSDELLHRMMGKKPIDSMSMFAQELGLSEKPEELLAERDERILACIRKDLRAMPGLFEIIEELKPVAKLAIGTGNTLAMVSEVLRVLGLEGVFDYIQTSDTVKQGKPSPEIFVKAANGLGLPPSEAAVLEDSANGIRAAYHAGCLAIAIPNEYTREQDFSLAHAIFQSLVEAKPFVLSWVKQ